LLLKLKKKNVEEELVEDKKEDESVEDEELKMLAVLRIYQAAI